jgi:anti-sigma factor RsiW
MSHLSDEEREELVAYLDGELDDEKSRRLEARLNRDPEARAEAEQLKRAWGMLDYLPRAQASTSFTHRTLERLAVETGEQRRSRLRYTAGLTWAAGMLLAALAGFLLARTLGPRPVETPDVHELLVRNLRIIERVEPYQQIDNIEFLQDLDEMEFFTDEP